MMTMMVGVLAVVCVVVVVAVVGVVDTELVDLSENILLWLNFFWRISSFLQVSAAEWSCSNFSACKASNLSPLARESLHFPSILLAIPRHCHFLWDVLKILICIIYSLKLGFHSFWGWIKSPRGGSAHSVHPGPWWWPNGAKKNMKMTMESMM